MELYLWSITNLYDQLEHGDVVLYEGSYFLVEWLTSDKVLLTLI